MDANATREVCELKWLEQNTAIMYFHRRTPAYAVIENNNHQNITIIREHIRDEKFGFIIATLTMTES